jgi:nitrogen regulatory protein PII-like uncharacterized protein
MTNWNGFIKQEAVSCKFLLILDDSNQCIHFVTVITADCNTNIQHDHTLPIWYCLLALLLFPDMETQFI